MKDIKVVHADREVLQASLIDVLGDGDKVAVILNKDDLDLMIAALHNFSGVVAGRTQAGRTQELLDGLRLLKKEAFKKEGRKVVK